MSFVLVTVKFCCCFSVFGTDFSFPNGFDVTFSAGSGSSTQMLTILVLDDDVLEGDHSFIVNITNTNLDVTVGSSSPIVIIINDDDCKSIQIIRT